MNEEFAKLVQDATVMVSRTASPHEDTVKSVGDLANKLTEVFEAKGADDPAAGIQAAKVHLDVVTKARTERAATALKAAPNPHL